jgi:hypothetical protein
MAKGQATADAHLHVFGVGIGIGYLKWIMISETRTDALRDYQLVHQ